MPMTEQEALFHGLPPDVAAEIRSCRTREELREKMDWMEEGHRRLIASNFRGLRFLQENCIHPSDAHLFCSPHDINALSAAKASLNQSRREARDEGEWIGEEGRYVAALAVARQAHAQCERARLNPRVEMPLPRVCRVADLAPYEVSDYVKPYRWGKNGKLDFWTAYRQGAVEAAELRAIELLRNSCDEYRADQYLYTGLMPAIGNVTGQTYIIRRDYNGVKELVEGVIRYSWCIHAREHLPPTDRVLSLKNMIEGEEGEFRKIGNRRTVYGEEIVETGLVHQVEI